ncbi:MAG: hypothetical protein C4K49_05325 [Candidatus Thorarchaeota archaeon]|nr:MAG: hypothetical protein C4K49_05325 [Candidatus Thorarchaeota archaeon]
MLAAYDAVLFLRNPARRMCESVSIVSSGTGEPSDIPRNVADLRTQFVCEYRLHLMQVLGDIPHPRARTGTKLHETRTLRATRRGSLHKTGLGFVVLLVVSAILLCLIGWSVWIRH